MGMNYYVAIKESPQCNARMLWHIGKSSRGWKFCFRVYKDIRSWKDWKEILNQADVEILDEDLQIISFAELEEKILRKQKQEPMVPIGYLDEQGFAFADGDFS